MNQLQAGVNFWKAFSKFQQMCPSMPLSAKGHNYTYTDLDTMFQIIKPVLQDCGLVILQPMDGCNMIKTILVHAESGEGIEATTCFEVSEMRGMNLYQSAGSAITYFRRYSVASMLGLVSDADLDANDLKQSVGAKKPLPSKHLNLAAQRMLEGTFESKVLSMFSVSESQMKQIESIANKMKNQ